MKTQKLLLPFGESTIIESVIQNIIPALNSNILVVLGSHFYEIKQQLSKLPLVVCYNEEYYEGMLSSVICGFKSLPEDAEVALVFLGDQPHIPAAVTEKIVEVWKSTGKGIIIPVFEGKRGHPVLIEMKYRSEIEQLDPEKGLRQLMQKFESEVCEVECNYHEILRDIDTPRDYEDEKLKCK